MKKNITAIMMRCRVAVVLPLFFLLCLYGCKTIQKEPIANNEPDALLRVGLANDVPLLSDKGSDAKLLGFEMNLLTQYARENKYILDTSLYSKDELFFALRRGEIDIAIAAVTDTVIAENFLLPSAPHLKTGQRVLVNDAVSMFIKDKDQLNNDEITVLTVVGSTAANFAKQLFPQAKRISLRDMKSCIKKALTDNGNIIMLDAGDAYILQSKNFFLNSVPKGKEAKKTVRVKLKAVLPPLTNEQISWALRRGDKELQNSLNSFIENMKKSGKLKELIELYNADVINE